MRLIFDIETNPIDFKTGDVLGQVQTVHCLVLMNLLSGQCWRFYDPTEGLRDPGTMSVERGVRHLEQADELIGHNVLQFDIPVLRNLFDFNPRGKITDTLVCSRLFYPDRPGGHSLREWGARVGAPKGEVDSFEAFTPAMLEYCEQDVRTNAAAYNQLQKEYKEHDWDRSLDLEHEFAQIITTQEQHGFFFNKLKAQVYVRLWSAAINRIDSVVLGSCPLRLNRGTSHREPFKINGDLKKVSAAACERYDIPIDNVAGPFSTVAWSDPDLNSHVQQKEVLKYLGWKPTYFTETGTPQIEDHSVSAIGPLGESILERNRLKTWRDRVQGLIDITDQNNRVHGGGNPCGTPTGRMRHSRIANIPRITSPFGRELRDLFCVPYGKILIGYDAAALELRILAHYIGSEKYIEAVTTPDKTRDAHVLAAQAAGSDDRDLGKTINYALIYGAGDRRLGSIIGGSPTAGADLRERLYSNVPGLQTLVNHVKTAGKRGYLIGLDGRRLYLRHRISPLNTLIQGGGAIFMKTAAAALDRKTKHMEAFKVLDMHDEAQWELPPEEAEELTEHIHSSFDYATKELKLRCPQEAELKLGYTWMETH